MVAGLNTAQVDGDQYAGYDRLDARLGAYVSYPLGKGFGFEAGLNYAGRGAKSPAENAAQGTYKTLLRYIEIPLLLRSPAYKEFSIAAGLVPAYLFSNKLLMNGTEQDYDPQAEFRNFDISGAVGVRYQFAKQWSGAVTFTHSIVSFRADRFWSHRTMAYSLHYHF